MKSTLMSQTPATGLSSCVATIHSAFTAPDLAAQGTGLSIAGTSAPLFAAAAGNAAQAVVVDVRNTDLPGSHPRGAPV